MGRGFVASWLVRDAALSRSVRVRFYREVIRDAGRTFRLSSDGDVPAARKRAALAAVPKVEGWTLRVFTVGRTAWGDRVAALLDRLVRREMGGPDFAAALAATLDGSRAVLAVTARDARRVERVGSGLGRAGRGPGRHRVAHGKTQQIQARPAPPTGRKAR
jgi:hypothetical protein